MKPTDFAAIATVIVALITWTTNLVLDRKRRIVERRAEAYIDYLTGLSRTSNMARESTEFRDADILMLTAKERILLYGTPAVIARLRDSCDGPRSFMDPEGRKRFVALIQAMQRDTGGLSSSPDEIVRLLIETFPRDPLTDADQVRSLEQAVAPVSRKLR